MINDRINHSLNIIDNKVYVCGGYKRNESNYSNSLKKCEYYDIDK